MASRRLIKVQTCPSKRDGVGISEGKADDYRVCIFDQELKDIEKSGRHRQPAASGTAERCVCAGDDLRTMGVTAAPKEEGNLLAWGGPSILLAVRINLDGLTGQSRNYKGTSSLLCRRNIQIGRQLHKRLSFQGTCDIPPGGHD